MVARRNADLLRRCEGRYVTDLAGTDVRLIADSTFRGAFNGWSTRGDRIIFTQYEAATSNVYVMNADGTAT